MLILVVGIVVLIVIMSTRVLFGQSREKAAVKAELNEGLQDWEAGAGDADGNFDAGPDEGADVGPGHVSLVDVDDGPDAGNGSGADAVGDGLSVRPEDEVA